MAASTEIPFKKSDQKKTSNSQRPTSQEEWISEEELYTEGSSDEDDMALRMKRRERREGMKGKSVNANQESRTALRPGQEQTEDSVSNQRAVDGVCSEQGLDDYSYKWRPTQGSLRIKNTSDSELPVLNDAEEAEADDTGDGGLGPALSLSEAYSNMHKLDALLRDSDRRLKEAQAETLRAQLSTRDQLRQLRDRVGGQNVMLARNWDAFMQLCPATDPGPGPGGRHVAGAAGDQGCSVLPRISGAESDAESDDSQSSGSALAITDEEKLKLAALLRDVDQDRDGDQDPGGLSGYHLDPEARRSLEHIDGKLQELIPDVPDSHGLRGSSGTGVAKGGTRQQRLEDIDRCLQALAASALGDVEPVGEDEVRSLLQGARGAPGPEPGPGPRGARGGLGGHGDDEAGLVDPSLIAGLLEEARRELPGFRYRHCEDADDAPVDTPEAQAQARARQQGLPSVSLKTPKRAAVSR